MTPTLQLIVWPLAAYLIGSISSAVIISKLFGLGDPRKVGSGNPGTTNVLRSGNKFAAAFTLLGDVAKGAIPVWAAQHYGLAIPVVALVAIAAFMGHLYPVFLKFKGGKGVATAIGVFIALSWKLAVVFIAVWLIVAVLSRYSSLAALLASAITGLASFAVFNQAHQMQLIGTVILIVAFLFQRHRDNLERLKNGTEAKIGAK
jgi:glycerol-3-phosphate acyltransferase PlsY